MRLPDERLFGTLCCVDRSVQPSLSPDAVEAFEELTETLGRVLSLMHRDKRVTRERDELLESVAHDLRTPLQSLRFLGQDLAAGATEPETAGVQVDYEAGRVLSMVDDIFMLEFVEGSLRRRWPTAPATSFSEAESTIADTGVRCALELDGRQVGIEEVAAFTVIWAD